MTGGYRESDLQLGHDWNLTGQACINEGLKSTSACSKQAWGFWVKGRGGRTWLSEPVEQRARYRKMGLLPHSGYLLKSGSFRTPSELNSQSVSFTREKLCLRAQPRTLKQEGI